MAGKSKAKYVQRCSCDLPVANFDVSREPMCQTCGLTVKRKPSVLPDGQHLQAQVPQANGTARPAELDRPSARAGVLRNRQQRVQAIADLGATIADSTTSSDAKRSLQFSLDRFEGLERAEDSPPPIAPPAPRRGPRGASPVLFTVADALKALSAPPPEGSP